MFRETFDDVLPPVAGGTVALAHSTTAARYKIPAAWVVPGHMVTVTSLGSDLHVNFGDAGVAVSTTKYAQATGETLAPNWASGGRVPAGSSRSFPVGLDTTHFAVVSSGTTGDWSMERSSGLPRFGEDFPVSLPEPTLWLDFGYYASLTLSTLDIAQIRGRTRGRSVGAGVFAEASNRPAWNSASAVGSGLMRAAASFTAGNSDKLTCTDSAITDIFTGNSSWTLIMPVRRGATGAAHTLFSVSTDDSANGHFDITLDASDDIVLTRVDSAGGSDSGTYATTVNTTPVLLTLSYDGSDHTLYVNRTAQALSAAVTGDMGAVDRVTIGARHINTTYDRYATAEIPEVLAFSEALNTQDLSVVHGWLARRYGV